MQTSTPSVTPAGREPAVLISAPGFAPSCFELLFPLSHATLTFPPGVSVLFAPDYLPPLVGTIPPPALSPDGAVAGVGPATAVVVIAYVLDCEGNPAINVSVTGTAIETPLQDLCSLLPDSGPGCSEAGALPTPAQGRTYEPGVVLLAAPLGQFELTAAVVQPQSVYDGGPLPVSCCTPALLAIGSIAGMGPPGTVGPTSSDAATMGPDVGSAPGPPPAAITYTDAGIPCIVGPTSAGPGGPAVASDAGCTPICSMDPGCIPAGPVLLEGGLIGSFSLDPPPGATNIVWIVPQPRAPGQMP